MLGVFSVFKLFIFLVVLTTVAVCQTSVPRPCVNGGYQDPNDCSRCLCPDGYGGTDCQQVAPPVNGQHVYIYTCSFMQRLP